MNCISVALLNKLKIIDENYYDDYVEDLYKEILLQVKEFNPDIIHMQHLSFGMALAFSKIKEIPKIAICHGTDILYSINNDFHKNNVINICNSSDLVVFPTNEIFNDFKRIISIDLGSKSKVIYWGIPKIKNNPKKFPFNPKKINLLYAGRLTDDKGVEVIIKSLSCLPFNYYLSIIGSGNCLDEIKSLVKMYGLNERIKLLPFMQRLELWKTFAQFDAIIISTREIESFCLVAVEAQAHGLPVIYSNTSGLREVVGESGKCFIPEDHFDLSKKILEMFKKSDYLDYSKKGFINANKFKIQNTIKELCKISEQLI